MLEGISTTLDKNSAGAAGLVWGGAAVAVEVGAAAGVVFGGIGEAGDGDGEGDEQATRANNTNRTIPGNQNLT